MLFRALLLSAMRLNKYAREDFVNESVDFYVDPFKDRGDLPVGGSPRKSAGQLPLKEVNDLQVGNGKAECPHPLNTGRRLAVPSRMAANWLKSESQECL